MYICPTYPDDTCKVPPHGPIRVFSSQPLRRRGDRQAHAQVAYSFTGMPDAGDYLGGKVPPGVVSDRQRHAAAPVALSPHAWIPWTLACTTPQTCWADPSIPVATQSLRSRPALCPEHSSRPPPTALAAGRASCLSLAFLLLPPSGHSRQRALPDILGYNGTPVLDLHHQESPHHARWP